MLHFVFSSVSTEVIMQVETNLVSQENKQCCSTPRAEVTTIAKIDKRLRKIAQNEGYISYDITKKNISSGGGSYLGELYEVDVKGKTVEGDKETAIFIKTLSLASNSMEFMSLPEVYRRELFVYQELSSLFTRLQDNASVPQEERLKMVKGYPESFEEAIIMESVTRKGFKTWYRMDVVREDMAYLCMIELAKLHGLSFVLQNQCPNFFNDKIKGLEYPLVSNEPFQKFLQKMIKDSMSVLDEDVRNKFCSKISDIVTRYHNYINDKTKDICMCHGDYRPNNVMIKETDGKITEVIPVDYQLVWYGCPVLDIMYFLYCATDYEFRKKNVDRLKDLYHETMKNFLKYFDIPIDSVFPRKVFDRMYQEKLDYGMMVTVLFGPFMFVSEDSVPDITKDSPENWNFVVDDRFKGRLEDAIRELVEWGLL